MVSNKFVLLVSACLALTVFSSAAAQAPHQMSRAETRSGFLSTSSLDMYASFNVCALVELKDKLSPVKKDITLISGNTVKERFLEFTVKVIDGVGVDADDIRRCYTLRWPTFPVDEKYKRFLLLGWSSTGDDLKVLSELSRPQIPEMPVLKVEKKALFVGMLVPTKQTKLVAGSTPTERVFLNLAETLTKGTDLSTVRAITSCLVTAVNENKGLPFETYPSGWIKRTFCNSLQRYAVSTPVDKLRINGLLADWRKPNGTLKYLMELPMVLKELRTAAWSPNPEDRNCDTVFLKKLSLCYGLRADDIVDIALSDPALRFLIYDRGLGVPSLENQKKLLTLMDDPSMEERAKIYATFAYWHQKGDWLLNSSVFHGKDGPYIPNEEEMRNYWHEKLGVPIGP